MKALPVILCARCVISGRLEFDPLGLPIHTYSEFVTGEVRQQTANLAQTLAFTDIPTYQLDGLAVGEHALAGALRYFARGTLDGEPDAEPVLRRYFQASLLTAHATMGLLDDYSFEAACFHHGIYVPQGVIGEVARQT